MSSNGNRSATTIVWAVVINASNDVKLYALDGTNGSELFSGIAGAASPNNPDGKLNVVPIVANGKVFVTSYNDHGDGGRLNIYGVQ